MRVDRTSDHDISDSSSTEVNPPASSSSSTSINSQSTLSSSQSQPKTGSFFDSIIEFFNWLWTKFVGLFVKKEGNNGNTEANTPLKAFEDLLNSQKPVTQGAFYKVWEGLEPDEQDDFLKLTVKIFYYTDLDNSEREEKIKEEKETINSFKDSNRKMELTDYQNAFRCLSVLHAWQATKLPRRRLEGVDSRINRLEPEDRRDLLMFILHRHGPKLECEPGTTDPILYGDGNTGFPFKDITSEMIEKFDLNMITALGKRMDERADEEHAMINAMRNTLDWICS